MRSTPIPADRIDHLVMSRFEGYTGPSSSTKEHEAFCADLKALFNKGQVFDAEHFQQYSIPTLLHYLQATHQFYLNKRLAEIELSVSHMLKELPEKNQWATFLDKFLKSYEIELREHIEDEETNLFPYIEALICTKKEKKLSFLFSQKIRLINFLLNHDHKIEDNLGQLIMVLRKKYDQFNDSFSFRMLLIQLEAFELDLVIHAKIEEEVLMPLALQLEKETLENSSF
ncbi:MAG: hypothetical protein AAFN93_13820 [Bacteroidota bacterium]